MGGAKRIVRFFGGKTYHRACPPKPVLEASESGICLVCAGFLQGKQQGENKRGGKTYHRWGGPKPFLGRGLMVCFPLPWVFHPPLFFSDIRKIEIPQRKNRLLKSQMCPRTSKFSDSSFPYLLKHYGHARQSEYLRCNVFTLPPTLRRLLRNGKMPVKPYAGSGLPQGPF